MVFLDYQYHFKFWSMSFRNPANFSDPGIKARTPIEAVHQMMDFLMGELCHIPPIEFQTLESMPRYIEVVLAARGGPMPY